MDWSFPFRTAYSREILTVYRRHCQCNWHCSAALADLGLSPSAFYAQGY